MRMRRLKKEWGTYFLLLTPLDEIVDDFFSKLTYLEKTKVDIIFNLI